MKMIIVFKQGHTLSIPVSKVTAHRNAVTWDIDGVEWVTPGGSKQKLIYLRFNEVAAVLREYETEENGDGAT